MNWLKLLLVSIICCFNIVVANTYAQSRPLQTARRRIDPDKAKADVTAARQKAAAARQKVAAAQAQVLGGGGLPDAKNKVVADAAQVAADQATATADKAIVIQNIQNTDKKSLGKTCWLAPASHCYSAINDKGEIDKNLGINAYYDMAQGYAFISQVKSIYNGASGTANLSAALASLNFPLGVQFIFGTNVQAGVTTPTTVATGSYATLTPTSAAQAAQNMITGGTFTSASVFPLLYLGSTNPAAPGKVIFTTDAIAKGGVDLQNFKANTNTTVINPPTHANIGLESYLQLNSTNLETATNGILGDIFVGGNYGYNYASHGYARDYGFGRRTSSGVGQIALGAVLSGIGRVSVSRGFGPSQVYVDSTSTNALPVPVNNFKSWSFGLTYQSPGAKSD